MTEDAGATADHDDVVSEDAARDGRAAQVAGAPFVLLTDLLPRPGSSPPLGINGLADDATTAALQATATRERAAWIGRDVHSRALLISHGHRRVDLDPRDVAAFELHSRATIWPIYHDMAKPVEYHQRWRRAYRAVNRAYATAAAEEAAPGAAVWIHDHKLQLVPGMLRRLRPDLRIGLHLQTPFPSPDLFRHMPMHRDTLGGLLGADLLGFQTAGAAENFLQLTRDTVTHLPQVGVYPTSVDSAAIAATAADCDVISRAATLRRKFSNRRTVILSMTTADQAYTVERRLLALAEFFRTGRLRAADVVIVQVVLGRTDDMEPTTADGIARATARLNGQHAEVGRPCVHYVVDNANLAERISLYLAADVMLAVPLREGSTIPALEFVAAARPHAALVLSEFSGSAPLLPDAYLVNPNDDDAVHAGIVAALAVSDDERADRMRRMQDYVAGYDHFAWARRFVAALRHCAPRESSPHKQPKEHRRPQRLLLHTAPDERPWLNVRTGGER